jgi:hypothetical protein
LKRAEHDEEAGEEVYDKGGVHRPKKYDDKRIPIHHRLPNDSDTRNKYGYPKVGVTPL